MTISCSHDLAAREEGMPGKEEATSLIEGVFYSCVWPALPVASKDLIAKYYFCIHRCDWPPPIITIPVELITWTDQRFLL